MPLTTALGRFIQVSTIALDNWCLWMYGETYNRQMDGCKNVPMDVQVDVWTHECMKWHMASQQTHQPSIYLLKNPKAPMATPKCKTFSLFKANLKASPLII